MLYVVYSLYWSDQNQNSTKIERRFGMMGTGSNSQFVTPRFQMFDNHLRRNFYVLYIRIVHINSGNTF
jgi:hypothetical protein